MVGISTTIEERLRVHRAYGALTWGQIAEHVIRARAEAVLPSMWDLSEATFAAWETETVVALVNRLAEVLKGPIVTVLVAPDPETYGHARVALAMLKARVELDGHVFSCEASARAWLRIHGHRCAQGRPSLELQSTNLV